MSWFGFGKKSTEETKDTFSDSSPFVGETSPFDNSESSSFSQNYGSSSMPSSGGTQLSGAALEGLQQQIMLEQQKMAVYQVIIRIIQDVSCKFYHSISII